MVTKHLGKWYKDNRTSHRASAVVKGSIATCLILNTSFILQKFFLLVKSQFQFHLFHHERFQSDPHKDTTMATKKAVSSSENSRKYSDVNVINSGKVLNAIQALYKNFSVILFLTSLPAQIQHNPLNCNNLS